MSSACAGYWSTLRLQRRIGLLGLPNSGKSTLFNALTRSSVARVGNFPFCTIDPNVAAAPVRDESLTALAKATGSRREVPISVEYVDIAGLVRGASKGSGLGNRFLGNVREVPVVLHVVRCHDDESVEHVEGGVDPVRDHGIIETELQLADFETCEAAVARGKTAKGGRRAEAHTWAWEVDGLLDRCMATLSAGRSLRTELPLGDDASPEEWRAFHSLNLLTAKPCLVVCNVDEADAAERGGNAHSKALEDHVSALRGSRSETGGSPGVECVTCAASLEADISAIEDDAERLEFRESYGAGSLAQGAPEPIDEIVAASGRLLRLGRYFTTGPEETRAWPVRLGVSSAREAAGRIHGDIAKNLICADVIGFEDLEEECGMSVASAKSAGLVRMEGPDYIVRDRDVIVFKHRGG